MAAGAYLARAGGGVLLSCGGFAVRFFFFSEGLYIVETVSGVLETEDPNHQVSRQQDGEPSGAAAEPSAAGWE